LRECVRLDIVPPAPSAVTPPWSGCPTFASASGSVRELSLDEAVGFLKGQIADYKLPETIERFDEFPMTGTDKIRRQVLRDWVLARHKAPAAS
jgi:acyl-CoA synthetase (AMP-forming)/AMP-acid ligase II